MILHRVGLCVIVMALGLAGGEVMCLAEAPVLALSQDDRQTLDSLLGNDVIGKPLPAPVVTDVETYFPLKQGTHRYRVTSGDHQGDIESHTMDRLVRENKDVRWRYRIGASEVVYLHMDQQGNLWMTSSADNKQGVISKYSPNEPGILKGITPGQTKRSKIKVKVYDLADPDDVEHSGYLEVAYTYLGAFEVKVPAGTFEGVLLKWDYKGKVGPATVQDVQYRVFAKDVGLVADIDRTQVSAFLVYNDNSKFGKVLLER